MSKKNNKEVKREDFDSFEEYVNEYERVRQNDEERRAKMTSQEVAEEDQARFKKQSEEYDKYVNDVARADFEASGLLPNEEVKHISREEAYSKDASTNLGKNAQKKKSTPTAPAKPKADKEEGEIDEKE